MCDDLHCHRAKLPAPGATKGKKVIKFERIEALPQTMHQCPWGRIAGEVGVGVTVCVYICVCVGGGGEAEKSLTFSGRVRERKEGKGELRMAFSHSVLLTAFLYRSTTCLFILFIYLSSFHFLSIALTCGSDPHPSSKSPLTALQQLFNALFWPLCGTLLLLSMLRGAHTQTNALINRCSR